MSANKLICQMKPYIQPFEKILAVKELEALSGSPAKLNGDGSTMPIFSVTTNQQPEFLSKRLTYWEKVYDTNPLSTGHYTKQVRREATAEISKNGISIEQIDKLVPFRSEVPTPNRRSLRYGSHGIHEYRGKFFPQLVRSLLNMSGAGLDSIVLDPMCGSGTTPVEASLLGCRAIGIDFNPLSVQMSRVKCGILRAAPEVLLQAYQDLVAKISSAKDDSTASQFWFNHLSKTDQTYLRRWFAPEILHTLDVIMKSIQEIALPECQALFLISLSNILRAVSWQKTDDLRVRKAAETQQIPDVKQEFIKEITRTTKTLLAFLYENRGSALGETEIIQGDARETDQLLAGITGQVDVIITSPPYATALPYLDTDRLSLCYLNLLPHNTHRQSDYGMIGNREINKSHKTAYWEEYLSRRGELPDEICAVIDEIKSRNDAANPGFRRQNLPSLLSCYFFDMLRVFNNFRVLLRENAPAYIVVGNNHTIAGGKRIEIETDFFLRKLGEAAGLELEEMIPMEMLVSRDIFKKNAGSKESILCFRNPVISPNSL